MIAKFAAILCLFGVANAGYLHGGYSGYSGYSGYTAPVYTTPLITKAVIPAVSYAPAVSTVSRYQVHSAPIVKTYSAPIAYTAPVAVYSGHGHGGYEGYGGYGGYEGYGGYGSKGLW